VPKTALLFGLSEGGISQALADQLLDKNHRIYAVSRNACSYKNDHPNLNCLDMDFSNRGWVTPTVGWIRKNVSSIDMFVHMSATSTDANSDCPLELTDDWRNDFEVNVFPVVELLSACNDLFRPGSRIVVCSSNGATRGTKRRRFTYAAAKSALNGLVKGSAVQLARKGITINAVSPSQTLTKRVMQKNRLSTDEEAVNKLPLSRYAKSEEVSKLIYYLLTDSPEYLTGQIIDIDGGTALNY
jgi:NAD(P)-dependent dehydrogenase (short-subunit alcohol dehydrogenase family)